MRQSIPHGGAGRAFRRGRSRAPWLLCAAATLVLAGCGTGTAPHPLAGETAHGAAKGPIDLSIYTYMPLASPAAATLFSGLIAGFERSHPNVHVTTDTPATASSLFASLQQDVTAGNVPDVAQVTWDALDYAVSQFGAQDLGAVVGGSALSTEWGGPYPYAPAVIRLGVVSGRTYVVPWTLSTPVLFYNASLFRQAGLDPAHPPTTWAQVESDALAIRSKTAANGFANGCLGQAASPFDWCAQAIVDSAGGGTVSANGKKVTFNAPGNVTAMQEMQNLAKSGAMADFTAPQELAEFGSGKLGMILNTSIYQATLLKGAAGHFDVRDTGLPSFGSRPATPTPSGSGLAILTKDHAKQQAAWELIKYLTSPSSITQITENIGYPPVRPSLATAPQYLGSWAKTSSLVDANIAQLGHIVPQRAYPGPNFAQIELDFVNATQGIAFGGESPKSALDRLQSQAASLVRQ